MSVARDSLERISGDVPGDRDGSRMASVRKRGVRPMKRRPRPVDAGDDGPFRLGHGSPFVIESEVSPIPVQTTGSKQSCLSLVLPLLSISGMHVIPQRSYQELPQ